MALQQTAETIEVVANGRACAIPAGRTVREFLIELDVDPDLVVVERNGEILRRDRLAEVRLEAGDALEIVHVVGGG
ncbi:MAG: sulfur carrier protein ThiS [Gemmatimonadota bacterium]